MLSAVLSVVLLALVNVAAGYSVNAVGIMKKVRSVITLDVKSRPPLPKISLITFLTFNTPTPHKIFPVNFLTMKLMLLK